MKIKFESDDDLSLGKILSIPVCIVAVGSLFKEDKNYYPQAHLHECLYEFVNEYKEYTIFVQYTGHCFNHWYLKNITNVYL